MLLDPCHSPSPSSPATGHQGLQALQKPLLAPASLALGAVAPTNLMQHSYLPAHGNVRFCCQLGCVRARLGNLLSFLPVKLQQLGIFPATSQIPASKLTGSEAAARQSLACKLRGEKAWHLERSGQQCSALGQQGESICDSCEPGSWGP